MKVLFKRLSRDFHVIVFIVHARSQQGQTVDYYYKAEGQQPSGDFTLQQSSISSSIDNQPRYTCQIRPVGLDRCSMSDLPRILSLPQASNISIHVVISRSPQTKTCSSEPSLARLVVRVTGMYNSKLLQSRLSSIGCQPRVHQLCIVYTSLLSNIQMFASLSWRSRQ